MKRNTTIKMPGSDRITITQKPLRDRLGQYNEKTGEIDIAENQPEVGKHIVLIHEFLHLVDAQLVQHRLTKRRIPHEWIRLAAPSLLTLLVEAGHYKGVTKRQLYGFVRKMRPR